MQHRRPLPSREARKLGFHVRVVDDLPHRTTIASLLLFGGYSAPVVLSMGRFQAADRPAVGDTRLREDDAGQLAHEATTSSTPAPGDRAGLNSAESSAPSPTKTALNSIFVLVRSCRRET